MASSPPNDGPAAGAAGPAAASEASKGAAKARRKRRPRRARPLGPPPRWSARLYLEIAPRHIAFLKFILEGCDNLAYLSVLNRQRALLQIVFSPHAEREVVRLLEGLRERLDLRWFRLAPAQGEAAKTHASS